MFARPRGALLRELRAPQRTRPHPHTPARPVSLQRACATSIRTKFRHATRPLDAADKRFADAAHEGVHTADIQAAGRPQYERWTPRWAYRRAVSGPIGPEGVTLISSPSAL